MSVIVTNADNETTVDGVLIDEPADIIDEYKDDKVWSLYANYFGEVNSYLLTLDGAIKMITPAVEEDGFEKDDLIIYIAGDPKEVLARVKE